MWKKMSCDRSNEDDTVTTERMIERERIWLSSLLVKDLQRMNGSMNHCNVLWIAQNIKHSQNSVLLRRSGLFKGLILSEILVFCYLLHQDPEISLHHFFLCLSGFSSFAGFSHIN